MDTLVRMKTRICKSIQKKFLRAMSKLYIKNVLVAEQEHFKKESSASCAKLIVFLLPGYDTINGGIMSITSIYEDTKDLYDIHKSKVIASKIPYDTEFSTFNHYTMFENDMKIFHFSSIIKSFLSLDSILIHIPEYAIPIFVHSFNNQWTEEEKLWWNSIPNRHINILNQNILMMPNQVSIESLRILTTELTQTTAHDKYATLEIQGQFGVTLHHLSVRIRHIPKKHSMLEDKDNIIMFSPDDKERRKKLIRLLKAKCPQYTIKVVKNMLYRDYVDLCKRAKFCITLGEGLDDYFITPMANGGVSFAVDNEDFFMEDYKVLPTIYSSYDEMFCKIVNDIEKYNSNKEIYEDISAQFRTIQAKYYSHEFYYENLRNFYRKEYKISNSFTI